MSNKTAIYLLYLFCITLPLFLLLVSFKTTIHFSELTPGQQKWMDYFNDKVKMPENYTDAEISHMQDVKKVLRLVKYLFYVLLLIITLIITYFRNDINWNERKNQNINKINKKEMYSKLFKYGGIATLSSIGFLFLISSVAFNFVFSLFHKIFFPQGNWQFPTDSLLIQTFPYSFFSSISIIILIQTVIFGIFFIVLSFYLQYDNQSKRS